MSLLRLPSLLLAVILSVPVTQAQNPPAPASQNTPAAPAAQTAPQPAARTTPQAAPPAAQSAPATPAAKPAVSHREAERPREAAAVPFSAYNAHPKLAIILVIDQFRGDYLDRWRADFKGRGFDLFLDHGAYFSNCYYDYANTKTAPGHATIGTGAYTDGHGISSNEWWDLSRNHDRPVSSVEDERYQMVGEPASSIPANAKYVTGSSPLNLRASTLGDELRLATQGQAKVFGISLKDRAAILTAGASANGAFWIDPASGDWITSTWYMQQLPDWAAAFNSGNAIAQAEQAANAAGTKNFYEDVGKTPAANDYEFSFAEALIQGEQLGQGKVTDLLTISLSANDIMGHAVGPDSPDEQQMVDALDTGLDSFFTWLDTNIPGGLGNVWIALTADHGIAPIPATAAQYGLNAAVIDLDKFIAALNDAINMKFSPGEKVPYILPRQELPYISLNDAEFAKAGINEQEAEQAVQQAIPAALAAQAPQKPEPPPSDSPVAGAGTPALSPSQTRLPPQPAIFRTYTREQLADGPFPPTPWGELVAHSYSPNGGWYVMVIPDAFQMASAHGTNHFTPYSYDRHVPLGFYGAPFAPGDYLNRVEPVDIAATFAALLGINQPSASVGQVRTEALRPAAQVVYPREAVPRPHHTTATRRPAAAAQHAAPEAAPHP
jgi:hypothetical protein